MFFPQFVHQLDKFFITNVYDATITKPKKNPYIISSFYFLMYEKYKS